MTDIAYSITGLNPGQHRELDTPRLHSKDQLFFSPHPGQMPVRISLGLRIFPEDRDTMRAVLNLSRERIMKSMRGVDLTNSSCECSGCHGPTVHDLTYRRLQKYKRPFGLIQLFRDYKQLIRADESFRWFVKSFRKTKGFWRNIAGQIAKYSTINEMAYNWRGLFND